MSSNTCERNKIIEQFDSKHVGLSFSFECNSEKCGNHTHYTNYLKYNALSDFKTGMGVTYVFCEYEGLNEEEMVPIRILGFVTLKASPLVSGGYGEPLEGHPAVEISELAVDKNYEGQGVGKILLNTAAYITKQVRENFVGIKYLTVCADPLAEGFYEHVLGFKKVSSIYNVPREQWNGSCVPMMLKIASN